MKHYSTHWLDDSSQRLLKGDRIFVIALQSSGVSELLIAQINEFRSNLVIFLWHLPGVQPPHYIFQQHVVEIKKEHWR